jgi:hypothetical protein
MNALYGELRLLQNLFLPSVKLVAKHRVGARVRRQYDAPRTPLDRVAACAAVDPVRVRALQQRRRQLDPIALATRIDAGLEAIYQLANHRVSPATVTKPAAGTCPAPTPTRGGHSAAAAPPHRGSRDRRRAPAPLSPTSARSTTRRDRLHVNFGNPNNGATKCRSVTVTYGLTGSASDRSLILGRMSTKRTSAAVAADASSSYLNRRLQLAAVLVIAPLTPCGSGIGARGRNTAANTAPADLLRDRVTRWPLILPPLRQKSTRCSELARLRFDRQECAVWLCLAS